MIRIAKRTVRGRDEFAIVTDNATFADARMADDDHDVNLWFFPAPSRETVKAILDGFNSEGWVVVTKRSVEQVGHVVPKAKKDGPGWTVEFRMKAL